MIKGGLPDYEITRDENAVESGMLAAYTRPNTDKPAGLVMIYGEHPVLRHIVYGQVAVAKVAHSEEMRGLVDRAVIDEMRSPKALTMALLGLMAEDCLIRQKLSKVLGKRRMAA
jgi:hypothetical protein